MLESILMSGDMAMDPLCFGDFCHPSLSVGQRLLALLKAFATVAAHRVKPTRKLGFSMKFERSCTADLERSVVVQKIESNVLVNLNCRRVH